MILASCLYAPEHQSVCALHACKTCIHSMYISGELPDLEWGL